MSDPVALLFGECGCCGGECVDAAVDHIVFQKAWEGWRIFSSNGSLGVFYQLNNSIRLFKTRRFVASGHYLVFNEVHAFQYDTPYSLDTHIAIDVLTGFPTAVTTETPAPSGLPEGWTYEVTCPTDAIHDPAYKTSANETTINFGGMYGDYSWTAVLTNEEEVSVLDQIQFVDDTLASVAFRPASPDPVGTTRRVYIYYHSDFFGDGGPFSIGIQIASYGQFSGGGTTWNYPPKATRDSWPSSSDASLVIAEGQSPNNLYLAQLGVVVGSGIIVKEKQRLWPGHRHFCARRKAMTFDNFGGTLGSYEVDSTIHLAASDLPYDIGPLKFCRISPECSSPSAECQPPTYPIGLSCVANNVYGYAEDQTMTSGARANEETYNFNYDSVADGAVVTAFVFVPDESHLVEVLVLENSTSMQPFPCSAIDIKQRYSQAPDDVTFDNETHCEMVFRTPSPGSGEIDLTVTGVVYYFRFKNETGQTTGFKVAIKVQAPCVGDAVPDC